MQKLYNILPHFLQNVMVTLYNIKSYRLRYGGDYKRYRAYFKQTDAFSLEELKTDQKNRFDTLVKYAVEHSEFYRNRYKSIENPELLESILKLPIISKEEIRKHRNDIYTISKKEGVLSKTGGTTGKSLEVLFVVSNFQERFAMLDNFRSRFGYRLGRRTAWFSGKNLLTPGDVKRNRFWKTDHWYKVRYYSTFHIKEAYLSYYIDDLKKFKPEFLVGFPSNLYEIAKYGLTHNINFPKGVVQAVFPTAENVLPETRETIETFFHTKMYDQYASSEGAPFIFECENGNLHLELQSGVFEVLDQNNLPSSTGRLIVTSFTAYGTPLIRYDIGDSIELSNQDCNCGNHNPLVQKILGREDDYIYSVENGKINLGNVSNTLKGTTGIVKFQAVQNEIDSVVIKLIIDQKRFHPEIEEIFLKNWRDRVGDSMVIEIDYVTDIPVERSGKFRIVKNNIKHLIV